MNVTTTANGQSSRHVRHGTLLGTRSYELHTTLNIVLIIYFRVHNLMMAT